MSIWMQFAVHAGEDTAFAPLVPQLLSALEGDASRQVQFDQLASLGHTYVTEMRARFPKVPGLTRIVDKMLRNAWNVGYIAVLLPKVYLPP